MPYSFRAALWHYPGKDGWHFVTLPPDLAEEIEARAPAPRRGFGALRVSATIGDTTWATSIFPDKRTTSYLLPVKQQVRTAERLADGDTVAVHLEVVAP